jgi:hypothetical protein
MGKSDIDDKAILEKRISMSSVSLLLDIFAQILKLKFSEKPADLPSEPKDPDNGSSQFEGSGLGNFRRQSSFPL